MATSTRTRPAPPKRSTAAAPAGPRVRRRLRSLLWRRRFVVAALAMGSAAAVAVHEVSPPPPDLTPVVVAARAVAAGSTLGADDVLTVDLPTDVVPADAIRDTVGAVGLAVAVDLTPGTVVSGPVLSTDLAAQAPPGTVIAAVRLAEPALAALLEPGMRVDLLAPAAQAPGLEVPGGEPGAALPGTYLARAAVVQPVPASGTDAADDGILSLGAGGTVETTDLVLVAVTPDEAASLANMAGWSAISAVLVH